ncbi:MAG TPA: AmmeMemoRadiSam system protein B [Burkholderiales bacterium]|nr:AmmeMemoRadiSam system protein B [Burkholderiales bacterium]
MNRVRSPAVAGSFYPRQASELSATVAALLESVELDGQAELPKALIAPHAGYIYSGPVAASAYARLKGLCGGIRRVVLLGPAHRVYVEGLALPSAVRFATPLGTVPLDAEAMRQIRALPQVVEGDEAHRLEHSLEVHLPFLQKLLGDFSLVPLVVGDAASEDVAQVLEMLWGGKETLVVISSDLSHYLPYGAAQQADQDTVSAILALRGALTPEQACGCMPVNGFLCAARRRALTPRLLDARNSGDTAGDKNRVVGYASLAFTEGAPS